MIEIITNNMDLKKLIASRGLKPTAQRIIILRYLMKNQHRHLTAEQIHDALHKTTPMLSLTTVYNTLASFVEIGLASTITITGSAVHYEIQSAAHHHLLCKKCNRIFDVEVQCPNATRRSIQGYQIDEVHGYFIGICRDCLEQDISTEDPTRVEKERR